MKLLLLLSSLAVASVFAMPTAQAYTTSCTFSDGWGNWEGEAPTTMGITRMARRCEAQGGTPGAPGYSSIWEFIRGVE